MVINVIYEPADVICQFVRYGRGKRLWLRDDSSWYPSIGWCPHLNIGGGECRDCSLVLEESDE